MKIQNIDRVLLFRVDANDHELMLDALQQQYGIEPDGTNFYYGVNQVNLDSFKQTSKALNPTHQGFFATLQSELAASSEDEKTLVIGLEPSQVPSPYQFLSQNAELLQHLASELDEQQAQAKAAGKRLNISIRFASEMNDGAQIQGHNPAAYRSTFIETRQIFSKAAPGVLFSFSPALRADLPESLIGQYWPGDAYVDIIGGTWYVGSPAQRATSVANMRAYFIHRLNTGRAFALSEVGGCDASGQNNDAVLQDMFHELESLQLQNVTFKYATIFLQDKWGTDATLKFLTS